MKYSKTLYGFSLISLIMAGFSQPSHAYSPDTAPVSGFARSFLLNRAISNASITILETGQQLTTDNQGHFGPIAYPIGKSITLEFKKWGYKTTQSGTFIVPPEGMADPLHNITFQVPSMATFYLFATIIGAKFDDEKCHVVTTVLANGRTLDDPRQGEANAKITLSPYINETPFYFDLFADGLFKNKTNPFTKGLTTVTEDGGVGFINLPVSDTPYTLSAEKAGVTFSSVKFLCRKGAFINISPPSGPMALQKPHVSYGT